MSRFILGNCIDVMARIPDNAIDFILTDPPYLVGFRDRSRRTIAGADTGKNGCKLPLRATGDFRVPFVINTYKPEDQLFVSRIHKEGNIQVCAALNGIVKTIKAQNFCVFFVKEVIVVKLHEIAVSTPRCLTVICHFHAR